PDHVNPEAPWPAIAELARVTESRGKLLVARLPSYPQYCLDAARWHDPAMATAIVRAMDSDGYARADAWSPGMTVPLEMPAGQKDGEGAVPAELKDIVAKARAGVALAENEVVRLFRARGDELDFVCEAADAVRRERAG